MSPRPAWRRIAEVWPYALVAFLYLATSPYHRGLNNPNEMVRVYMSKALVDHDSFAIDRVLGEWGPVDDKAIREGRLYSSKAPLQSLVGAPAYAVVKRCFAGLSIEPEKRAITTALRIAGSASFGILLASALLAWCRRRASELGAPAEVGTSVGLALALGTMLYPYALTFTGHLLAAAAAGGTYLSVVLVSRSVEGSASWRARSVLAGFLAGAAPFAEYPAALAALPALSAAFFITRSWPRRVELLGWLALGGALPFALGLWAHHELWGSALRTGYAFLENTAYVEVHGAGFFGVSWPRTEALAGALASPGTGLFFFSPVLILGLAAIVGRVRVRLRRGVSAPLDLHPALAVAALAAFVLEILFIAGHKGWRGGWTLGPRYIIPVAPLLGLWVMEAARAPRLRPWIAAFGALSIVLTGAPAALYPHLSDVYTNPLWTFVLPSYAQGYSTYGLGHWIGLEGGLANVVHLLPLSVAAGYVAVAGVSHGAEVEGSSRRRARLRRVAFVLLTACAATIAIAAIPEKDPLAAERENRRLWSFWEPRDRRDAPRARTALLRTARQSWREVKVEAISAEGGVRPCRRTSATSCSYGPELWQRFGPDFIDLDGKRTSVLFLHPIAGHVVRAEMLVPEGASMAVLSFGLADQSLGSDNAHPVMLRVAQEGRALAEAEAGDRYGLEELELTLSSSAALTLEIEVERDGARVFGFDVAFHR